MGLANVHEFMCTHATACVAKHLDCFCKIENLEHGEQRSMKVRKILRGTVAEKIGADDRWWTEIWFFSWLSTFKRAGRT